MVLCSQGKANRCTGWCYWQQQDAVTHIHTNHTSHIPLREVTIERHLTERALRNAHQAAHRLHTNALIKYATKQLHRIQNGAMQPRRSKQVHRWVLLAAAGAQTHSHSVHKSHIPLREVSVEIMCIVECVLQNAHQAAHRSHTDGLITYAAEQLHRMQNGAV